MLTQTELKKLIHYDLDTGIFMWLKRNSNRIKIGHIAGWINDSGYRIIQINSKNYRASRLAWFYMKGYFPEHEIDHKNRIRNDDRWINLRHVSRQCNTHNCSIYKNNTSGIKGIGWRNDKRKWEVRISNNKKLTILVISKRNLKLQMLDGKLKNFMHIRIVIPQVQRIYS